MVDKTVRLNHEQRENLVAYLDGELDDSTTQEIDDVLARSNVARHEVESLSRVWDLLDVLPRTRATEEFTQQTLASLAVEENPQSRLSEQTRTRIRQGGQLALWVATLLMAATVGYFLANRAIPSHSDRVIENLPVLERFEDYKDAGSVEFLRQLKQNGVLRSEVVDPPEAE